MNYRCAIIQLVSADCYEKNEEQAHIHIPHTQPFLAMLRLQTVSVVYLILVKFLGSKGAYTCNSQEKSVSEFPANIMSFNMSFITTKFNEFLLSGFRGVELTKKKRTDGLTEGWVKNIIPSASRFFC